MLYKIFFTYTEPETGKRYELTGIKDGRTPGEAKYYFSKQYQHSQIEIKEAEPIEL